MVGGGKLNRSGQPIMWILIITMFLPLSLGIGMPTIRSPVEISPKLKSPLLPPDTQRLDRRMRCVDSDITAEYGTRAIIRCRLGRPDTLRLRVWRYPIHTKLWDDESSTKTLLLNTTIPPGGVLVYDNLREQNGMVNEWSLPGGPRARVIYSMRGPFPKQHFIIKKTTPDTQGVYLWTVGPPDLPDIYGVLTRVRMVREPTLRLVSQPAMIGELTNATCQAEYYPDRPVDFVWLKNGVPINVINEHIQFQAHDDASVATSTIAFVAHADGSAPTTITCQLSWRNESNVLMYRVAREQLTMFPRPTMNITFIGEVATCTAHCVPDNVSLTWVVDDNILPPDHSFVTLRTCAHNQTLKSLRSELPAIHMSQRYTCRLSGYPSSILAPEYNISRPFDTNDTITQQLIFVLKIVGGTIGFLGLLILLVVVCTRVCR
ncbi:glycoprotein C [Macropodid alphaherpesvirus 1]|uniref:Envelope glycoprotein C n=1 Tax=Macropodid alphaherpesvirus 1 TaxID=137443 RepID=A0A0Y0A551_9ALPH|nr:glycoprotein C [Macropodid alphaherpesvirus 1]AMB17029.1 glycoprotein C [Macropodid alphaherpesvirus 1]